MKKLFTFTILLYSFAGFSQDWIHSGSRWHYNYLSSYSPLSEGYHEYLYTKDTVVSQKQCHQLSIHNYEVYDTAFRHSTPPYYKLDTFFERYLYTYASSDTVYFYYGDQWHPIYFFGAQLGDTIYVPAEHVSKAVVDSTGSTFINGQSLRFYRFSFQDSCNGTLLGGTIMERFGWLDGGMIPFWAECGWEYFESSFFTCYQDDSFASYSDWPGLQNCRFIRYTSIEDLKGIIDNIRPNPAQNEVTIQLSTHLPNATLVISDMTGRICYSTKIETDQIKVSTGALTDGMYAATILVGTELQTTKKLTIMH